LLAGLSSNYFDSLGDDSAVLELSRCDTILEMNEVIIKHSNIKEKRIRAKKMIKHLPKNRKYK
jgi:hypothetical protein